MRQNQMMALTVLFLSGCATAKVTARRDVNPAQNSKATVIYVADFDLEASDVKASGSLPSLLPTIPGPLGDILPTLPGTARDPKKVAKEVRESMSDSLVKELTKAGFSAQRCSTVTTLPKQGWLVRGVFTQVNQGNQLTRAVIGFGVGKTELQAAVDVSDLTVGIPEKFYELNTAADSGKAPGAGPMIVLGPAGAAARFVIAGKDLDRNVKQTAAKIAVEVIERTRKTEFASAGR